MKKITLGLLIAVSIIGCKKDINIPVKEQQQWHDSINVDDSIYYLTIFWDSGGSISSDGRVLDGNAHAEGVAWVDRPTQPLSRGKFKWAKTSNK
jgi:hypothetical protein